MADMEAGRTLTHIGMLVSDVERAARFYCEALGFAALSDTIHIGSEFGQLGGQADFRVDLRFIRRDGITIELMGGHAPPVTAPPARDRCGLWHLCLNVDDIDAQVARILEHGGSVAAQSRTVFDLPGGQVMEIVYCADPDGQPVELTCMAPSLVGDYTAISQGRARPPAR
jgi:catechol 2,3-dioxygenase-like lactoylglutathione lyase family enzyme